MPGFERDEIDVRWRDGTFTIAEEDSNGVLEVRIPIEETARPRGRRILIEG